MAVGLPVIATTSGGFPSMINLDPARLTGWLVAPDNVDALADAFVDAVNRPAERRRRGEHALAHARAHLSWNDLIPRFEDAYTAAIARHAGSRNS
jgi:glycosyltransferase involved in cell wall biosynthesis